MALLVSIDPGTKASVISPRMCVKAIRRNRRLLDEAHSTQGCNYQKLIAEMNDDKDLTIGLPCYECRRIIELGEEYVSRRTNRTPKYYHVSCGIMKNLI